MPCYKPLQGWQDNATRAVTFKNPHRPGAYKPLKIPCGQCTGCRLERSRQWAIRMVHEAQLHENNCFITLTYSDENLPARGSLDKEHLQKFIKRLRYHAGIPISYFACGEYGDHTRRAHYHACIFGIDFKDKIHFKRSGDHNLYISKQLEEIWDMGHTTIGNLTFETAAYTARYVMKKQLGKGGHRYVHLDEETGEITDLQQPFAVMSLRPAIASRWLRQYAGDVYANNKDYLVLKGKKLKPPTYYDKLYDTIDPHHMQYLKIEREKNHVKLTDEELRTREKIAHARTKQIKGKI